jgi:uncharacterized protein YeaO (DUF488 family)
MADGDSEAAGTMGEGKRNRCPHITSIVQAKSPGMTGRLSDTYVAALQHDIADIPEGATRVGVVRRPTSWFHGPVDENRPALAPPADLLDDVKATHETLEAEGLDDATAHNRAMDAVDYEERYRAHLETPEARAVMDELVDRLANGEDIALVCYENTDEKRCHRTLLASELERRLEA